MNRLALAFLILSTLLYAVFMVIRVDGQDRGWVAWREVGDHLSSGEWLQEGSEAQENVLMGGFVVTSFLAVGGPFLLPLVSRSRLGWWIAMVLASCAAVGIGLLLYLVVKDDYPPGLGWLGASLACHLAGLVSVRGPVRKEAS